MNKRNFGIIFIAITLVAASFYYINHSKEVYGNDKDSIVKVIKSIKGYEDQNIKILGVKDFNGIRIVGFLGDNSPAYIEFHKNQKGNYIWRHIEAGNKESFRLFLPLIKGKKFMFMANNHNKIAKIQVNVNGETIEQKFTPFTETVTWIDLPQSDTGEYEFLDYKYYDKDGNLIQYKDN